MQVLPKPNDTALLSLSLSFQYQNGIERDNYHNGRPLVIKSFGQISRFIYLKINLCSWQSEMTLCSALRLDYS